MNSNLLRIVLIGYLAFLSTGCNQVPAASAAKTPSRPPAETALIAETQTMPTVATQEDEMQTDPSLPIPAVPGLPKLIEKARADLSQRLSVPASQIETIEAREVFWPDASLGCPQSGETYAQASVPGYLLILESNGNEFEYHANIHGYVFYCESPTPPMLETPTNPAR